MSKKPDLIVVFRKNHDGIPIALFPDVPAGKRGNCLSYGHWSRHGNVDYQSEISWSRPAKLPEYRDLLQEIKGLYGAEYRFVIRQRYTK